MCKWQFDITADYLSIPEDDRRDRHHLDAANYTNDDTFSTAKRLPNL